MVNKIHDILLTTNYILLHRKFPLPLPYSSLVVSTTYPRLSLGIDDELKKTTINALCPIIPNNACILCITAVVGTELADAYSSVIAASPGKKVHFMYAFYLNKALLSHMNQVEAQSNHQIKLNVVDNKFDTMI